MGNTLAEFLPFPLCVDTADMYIHDMFYFCNIPLSLYNMYIYIYIYVCLHLPKSRKTTVYNCTHLHRYLKVLGSGVNLQALEAEKEMRSGLEDLTRAEKIFQDQKHIHIFTGGRNHKCISKYIKCMMIFIYHHAGIS